MEFDYEITLLTIRHLGQGDAATATAFCQPIGHIQEDGDYRESWQPHPMSAGALAESKRVAGAVTEALSGLGEPGDAVPGAGTEGLAGRGLGLFGVELFVRGDEVLFSEVSPRPHDTGMATMATQRLSEFALHVRAILGLPIPVDADGFVPLLAPGASAVLLAGADGDSPMIEGLAEALAVDATVDVRLFAKPDARPGRRMGVALATGPDAATARVTARAAAAALRVT